MLTDVVLGNSDSTNTYDNFFVLRGALFASNKFTCTISPSDKSYPAAIITEKDEGYDPVNLGNSINQQELDRYGVWVK